MDPIMHAYDDGTTTYGAVCLPPKVAYLTDEARGRIAGFAREGGRPLANLVLGGDDPAIDRGNPPIILHGQVDIEGEAREVYALPLEDGGVLLCAVAPGCLKAAATPHGAAARVAYLADKVVDESAGHAACGDARAAKLAKASRQSDQEAISVKYLAALKKLSSTRDSARAVVPADATYPAWVPVGRMAGMPLPVYLAHCENIVKIMCGPTTGVPLITAYLQIVGCRE